MITRNVAQNLLNVPSLTMKGALDFCEDISKNDGGRDDGQNVTSETEFIEEYPPGIDYEHLDGVNRQDVTSVKMDQEEVYNLHSVNDEDYESQIEDIMDATEELIDEETETPSEVMGVNCQEKKNQLPDPGAKSQAVAMDIQDTIGLALKSDELTPKHLLSIMQKMFQLQKDTIGNTLQDDNRVMEKISDAREQLTRKEVSTKPREFTKEQILRALQVDTGTSSEWIMKKAAMSIAYCGGLSIREVI